MNQDANIWDRFRKGEITALESIYFQNVEMLCRYGRKFTSNDGLIKDTIQDLFIELINKRTKLGETDNISFYLMACFRRRLARVMAQNHRFMNYENQELITPIVYSAEQELIHKESLTHREQKVRTALASLSNKQRELLYYRFTCDFSYEQICEVMDINYDTARKQVYRAIKSMREILYKTDIFVFFLKFIR